MLCYIIRGRLWRRTTPPTPMARWTSAAAPYRSRAGITLYYSYNYNNNVCVTPTARWTSAAAPYKSRAGIILYYSYNYNINVCVTPTARWTSATAPYRPRAGVISFYLYNDIMPVRACTYYTMFTYVTWYTACVRVCACALTRAQDMSYYTYFHVIILYYIVLYFIILCCVILYYIVLYYIIRYHTSWTRCYTLPSCPCILCYVVSYHIISYYIFFYHVISYHISHDGRDAAHGPAIYRMLYYSQSILCYIVS
jgi:hypothetical protein